MLGATVLDDLWKAKYIVISESIRSLALVAKRLRVPEERFRQHFENNIDVRCVVPSWADYCIASAKALVIPCRIHVWCHSPTFNEPIQDTITSSNTSRKRNRHGTNDNEDNNEKETLYEKSSKRDKVSSTNYDAVKTRKRCRFLRNIQVADEFKKLSDLHLSMSLMPTDVWKSYCFRIVAGRLSELDFEIGDDDETQRRLRSIKGFGKSVCEKIQECIQHGTIARIQEFNSDPQRQAMRNLKDIWGVGTVGASDLMDRGYTSIDDVRLGIRQNRLSLERNQLVGVDCYEDILDPMSRSEVEEIGEIVRLVAEKVFPGIESSIMGSYRRGKDGCGDVDIQLTHPAYVKKIPANALGRIIGELVK